MVEWVWSDELEAPVRRISETLLWGRTTVEAIDVAGIVHHLPMESTRSLDEVEHPAVSLRRNAALLKLVDHLARPDTLTAHLSPTLLPLPHQISHVERALTSPTTRLLIADEVGLGKTISAALILRELLNRRRIRRILILCPAGLVAQWILELRTHVGIEPTPLFTGLSPTPNSARVWSDHDIVITTHDAARPLTKRRGWSVARIEERNSTRFEGAVSASWDAIIIDEAHRMPGATTGVARHALASSLAGAAPHLLLLTGTPHQGKAEQFHRLVEFLDPDAFPTPESVTRDQVERHLIRVNKKEAVDMEGHALFVERATHLHVIPPEERRASERDLEVEMREYIRDGYAMDQQDRRGGHGFLMALFGRLLASSTSSLLSALEGRRSALLDQNEAEWSEEEDSEEKYLGAPELIPQEVQRLGSLINLARSVRADGPDTKATSLIQLLRNLEMLEKNPDVKVLIFTEFTATQRMLDSWLERHGISTTILNGSMSIEQRLECLRSFKEESRVLISTEAGGEGLNLQFCHLIVNYDLPWNPMRLEQRIGRVHRIGQSRPVTAYNMVLGGSTEARVIEVIERKLKQILAQLGVDKLSDVLDSSSVETDIDKLYRTALESDDETAIEQAQDLFDELLERASLSRSEKVIQPTEFDLGAIRERLSVPVAEWASMIDSESKGDIRHPSVTSALTEVRMVAPGESIPVIRLPDFPDINGWWSLWRIGIIDRSGQISRTKMMPMYVDQKGASFATAGIRIWDSLISNEATPISFDRLEEGPLSMLRSQAESSGSAMHDSLWSEIVAGVEEELSRMERAHATQAAAISRLGLEEVRKYRLTKLADRHAERKRQIEQMTPQGSRLEPLQVIRLMEGE